MAGFLSGTTRSRVSSTFSSAASWRCSSAPGRTRIPSPSTTGPNEDRFRAYIGAMIGIGTPAFRDADSISDFAKLQYAGLLAARVKSASRLRSFLSSFFETRVEIDEFVGAWLELDPTERTRLGQANSRLGDGLRRRREHVHGQRQVSHPRLCARHRAFPASSCPARAVARQIADAVFLYRRATNTTGTWSSPSPRARSRRSGSARTSSSAGRAGCRRTGRRPTRPSARTRASTS